MFQNPEEQKQRENSKKTYTDLKVWLISTELPEDMMEEHNVGTAYFDKNFIKINKFYPALDYMLSLEVSNENLRREISEYKMFFDMLNRLGKK